MSGDRRPHLFELHQELGAKIVPFGGWEMPLSYPTGTLAEHLACRSDAVVFDVSHLGTVRATGDVLDTLQLALSNDLTKIEPGRAQYTHLLNEGGGVEDDIIVWWVADNEFDVMPNASNTSRVTSAIPGRDVTSERCVLAVQGPKARERLAQVDERLAAVGRFRVERIDVDGVEVRVAGTGYTGEDGVELAVPNDLAESILRRLIAAGIQPAGLGARDTLRLEAALPLHGHELGPSITPLEARLGWVVGWDKEHFTGREALVAQRERGPERLLTAVVADGRQPLREHAPVVADGVEVGELTSGNYSPILERGIGIGFASPSLAEGDAVSVSIRGRDVSARVVKPPFVRKAK
jgi:aminomethyltransferase